MLHRWSEANFGWDLRDPSQLHDGAAARQGERLMTSQYLVSSRMCNHEWVRDSSLPKHAQGLVSLRGYQL